MANAFYNRGASFNPDELADGDAIEAEFDSVSRGFDTIKDLVNANKAGYPTQTFFVAAATEPAHAIQKQQFDDALNIKLNSASYTALDVLSKIKTVDGSSSGLDSDLLDGQEGSYYRNASNINYGTLAKERLPGSIDSNTTGNAATANAQYTLLDVTSSLCYLSFVASINDEFQTLKINPSLSYNPSTNVLSAIVISDVAEVGKISMFARSSAPSGYLKCNGAAVSRTSYAALFAVIGTTFGAGDGSTTFNVPDLRGEFVRGWDDARGVDSGRAIGSGQSSQNLAHTHSGTTSSDSHSHTFSATTGGGGAHSHTIPTNSQSGGSNTSDVANGYNVATGTITTSTSTTHTHTVSGTTGSDSHTHTMTTDSNGGAEVRVRNIALLYCIKY